MSKMKLKIGEFSQMMQVTVKTLRHYEQKGLLLPDEVDEWTGYRYYSIDQMQKLQSIRDLQRLGSTPHQLYRWSMESGGPGEMAISHSNTYRINTICLPHSDGADI